MAENKENVSTWKKWCGLKYYQYELNTGIYMLEPWEKHLFNFILLGFLLLCFLSSYYFMPGSIQRGIGLLQSVTSS